MRELVGSTMGFASAVPLFGARQAGRLFSLKGPQTDEAVKSFDAVTRSIDQQLGGSLSTWFGRLDSAQRGVIDLAWSAGSLDLGGVANAGGQVLESGLQVFTPPLAALDYVVPGTDLVAPWEEFTNKVEVYLLVRTAEARLGIKPNDTTPLPELVARAYALGEFPSLWAIEGLGHFHGKRAMDSGGEPRALLTRDDARDLPHGSLTMLHAGIGLAFAQSLMDGVKPTAPAATQEQIARRFIGLCRDNCQPEYLGCALESLGLVTRTFHSPLVSSMDGLLRTIDEETRKYYWHGVGRAIYFAPDNFLPCFGVNWPTVTDIASDDVGRHNIIAGLAWAITVVNMRQPRIMQALLRQEGDLLSRNDAFANGVASSIVMRYDTTPGARIVGEFKAYRPTDDLDHLWASLVGSPARNAVDPYHRVLSDHHRLGQVFRHQSLAELVRGLEGGGPAATGQPTKPGRPG